MHKEIIHEDGRPRLEEMVALGVELPGNVLTRRFEQYLFFDIDVTTSEPLIAGSASGYSLFWFGSRC